MTDLFRHKSPFELVMPSEIVDLTLFAEFITSKKKIPFSPLLKRRLDQSALNAEHNIMAIAHPIIMY